MNKLALTPRDRWFVLDEPDWYGPYRSFQSAAAFYFERFRRATSVTLRRGRYASVSAARHARPYTPCRFLGPTITITVSK